MNGSGVRASCVSLNFIQLGVMKAIKFKRRPSRSTHHYHHPVCKALVTGKMKSGEEVRREEGTALTGVS